MTQSMERLRAIEYLINVGDEMQTDFKVGQKLICVDVSGITNPKSFGLEQGRVLTVGRVVFASELRGGQNIWFVELDTSGPWYSIHFEPYLGPPVVDASTPPINDYVCKACR